MTVLLVSFLTLITAACLAVTSIQTWRANTYAALIVVRMMLWITLAFFAYFIVLAVMYRRCKIEKRFRPRPPPGESRRAGIPIGPRRPSPLVAHERAMS